MAEEASSTSRVWVFPAGAQPAAAAYRAVAAQPNWVMRAAILAFLIVVGIPALIVFLLAAFAAAAVFAVGMVIHRITRLFAPRDDAGRENVRIIRRIEQ